MRSFGMVAVVFGCAVAAGCASDPAPEAGATQTQDVLTVDAGASVGDNPTDTAGSEPVDADRGRSEPEDTAEAGGTDEAGAVAPPEPDVAEPTPAAMTAAQCFESLHAGGEPPVDYDQFAPVIGTHCKGTAHQTIVGVERVVFVGDSITVGTPPTPADQWYRNVMANSLAAQFGLEPPDWAWQNVDLINGVGLVPSFGDFWNCAKWGARTDDVLREPHQQLVACNPEAERQKTTLVVMTVGGNDLFAWAQDLAQGVPLETIAAEAEAAVQDLEDAIHWLVDEPERFPNGVYVVFANPFEFSDPASANDFASCPGANLIAMDKTLVLPEFTSLAAQVMAEYVRIAVETGTDVVFMGEHYCGHGHTIADEQGRCYRGPDAELWVDITCMHPNGPGHAGIADLFLSVITPDGP